MADIIRTVAFCLVSLCIVGTRAWQMPNLCLAKQFDVVMVVDVSGSTSFFHERAKAFTQHFANLQNIGECAVRFSIIEYSKTADDLLDLDDGDTRCKVNQGISKITLTDKLTCTVCGLKEAQEQFKKSEDFVPELMIVLTNGGAMNPAGVKLISQDLKKEGVTAICINLSNTDSSQGCLDITDQEPSQVFGITQSDLLAKVQKKWCEIVDGM